MTKTSKKKYTLFLSFTEADKTIAEHLYEFLSNEFMGEVEVHFSKMDIKAGDDWKAEIKRRVAHCDAIISLVTPRSLFRPWIYVEWSAFWMAGKKFYVLTTPDLRDSKIFDPMLDLQNTNITDEKDISGFVTRIFEHINRGIIPYAKIPDFVREARRIVRKLGDIKPAAKSPHFFEELHHVNLPVKNLKASIKFYRDILLLDQIERPFKFPGAWFGLPSGQHIHLVEDKSLRDKTGQRIQKNIYPKGSHFALRVNVGRWKEIEHLIAINKLPREASPDKSVKITQIYTLDPDCNTIEINELTSEQRKLKPLKPKRKINKKNIQFKLR